MDSSNPSAPQAFRIAIVGGGLGGLFTALCIQHFVRATEVSRNIQIDVFEQAPQYREIGAGVGVGTNAVKLLHKIGIDDRLRNVAGKAGNGIWVTFRRFDNGEDVVTVPAVETEKIRNAAVARSELLDLLVDEIRQRKAAELHTNKCCKGVEDRGDTVLIRFEDGTDSEANLVIGCDGIHSSIRSQFSADNPVYGGMIAYRAIIPTSSLPSPYPFPTYSVTWIAKGRHFLTFPIAQNKLINIVAFVTKPEAEIEDTRESWTSTCDRRDVERDFAGFTPLVQHMISQMPERSSKWRLNYRDPLDQWTFLDGKVVLMGDAAHPMLPHQGAGAGQAVEDGYILAQCVADYLMSSQATPESTTGQALLKNCMHLYQTVRLPRAQKVAVTSKEAGETYEMVTKDMIDKDFEQCIPIVHERVKERMKWLWSEDLDVAYTRAKRESVGRL